MILGSFMESYLNGYLLRDTIGLLPVRNLIENIYMYCCVHGKDILQI